MSELRINISESDFRICQNALSKLEVIDQNKVIKKAMREGAKTIIAQGKSNLASRNKKRKGNLSHSFGSNPKPKWKKVYAGFKRPKGAASHLVDRGTKERWTKKGAYRGRVQGTFFWTDAVHSEGPKAIQELMDTIILEVNNIVN